MRRLVLMSLLGLALLAASVAPAGAQDRNFRFAFTLIGLDLPSGLATSITPYGPDDIYTVKQGDKTLVELYVGNHPLDTVFKEHQQFVMPGYIDSQPERTIVYDYPGGIRSRETIVALKGGQAWPRYVHAWYLNLTTRDAELADRIISSIGPYLGLQQLGDQR